jgi:peptidyl-prolyl cis-trans isomerase A (cyclophilin A)
MARLAPGTAGSAFFICIGDQAALDEGGRRARDGRGFAAFGRVTEGMETIRAIHRLEAAGVATDACQAGQLLDPTVRIRAFRKK